MKLPLVLFAVAALSLAVPALAHAKADTVAKAVAIPAAIPAAAPLGAAFKKISKPEAEWKKQLSPLAYDVLRHQGTEMAFSGPYWNDHQHAVYHCAACNLPLFRSEDKFDSGTGWPSFTRPIAADAVAVTLIRSVNLYS